MMDDPDKIIAGLERIIHSSRCGDRCRFVDWASDIPCGCTSIGSVDKQTRVNNVLAAYGHLVSELKRKLGSEKRDASIAT